MYDICSNIDGGSDDLILIPWLFTDPSEPDAGICSNFDSGGLCSGDGLFNALHEVLRISHQHIRGFQVFLCSLNMKRYLNRKNVSFMNRSGPLGTLQIAVDFL